MSARGRGFLDARRIEGRRQRPRGACRRRSAAPSEIRTMARKDDRVSKIARGVRFDLVIAICALAISTFAAGASWWQARVLQTQTRVLQDQLGAQVWPYVSVTEGFRNDRARISLTNDGLGPAILLSAKATVDGVAKSNFIDILHAILGSNLVARSAKGERMGLSIDSAEPGSVIRPGNDSLTFSFTSKQFATAFVKGLDRLDIQVCYCAILPGKCWLADSRSALGPVPASSCPPISGDLLHAPALEEVLNRHF